jgi:PAS domain S-box-containing protein
MNKEKDSSDILLERLKESEIRLKEAIKAGEVLLQKSEKETRAIIEAMPDLIFKIDNNGVFVAFQGEIEELVAEPQAFIGKHVAEVLPEDLAKRTLWGINEVLEKKSIVLFEYPLTVKDKTKYFEARFNCIDENNVLVLVRNITTKRLQEEELKESLKEKELLIREIHHRVKNNLQVITSLLNLQSGYITDPVAAEYFRESKNRVKAISLIHEKVYRSSDPLAIVFNEYVRDLISFLYNSYSGASRIKPVIEVGDYRFDIDTSISLGLIINELVSNVIKYGFPEGRKGFLRINLTKNESIYTLIMEDDGIGVPADFNIEDAETLGFQLIVSLTGQIRGSIDRKHQEKGTFFTITFPC